MDAKGQRVKPRIIIHGGAGNITPKTVPPKVEAEYRKALLNILRSGQQLLEDGHNAVDVATEVVTLFEDDPLFNAGRGAVFTRDGTIELEASIMVSHGYRKRGVGCMRLTRVKHPIQLAREMLLHGEDKDGKGGGAYAHSQLCGEALEALAEDWGLEMVDPKYFWTQKRWDEHKRGLERENGQGLQRDAYKLQSNASAASSRGHDPSWDVDEYLPQGTVGAVVLDSYGMLCTATSTGGLTNKVTGRIGDTPTLGAGFWAEQWKQEQSYTGINYVRLGLQRTSALPLLQSIGSTLSECLSSIPVRQIGRQSGIANWALSRTNRPVGVVNTTSCAVAMSGTGNGDSFLRVNAVRTAGAMVRFSNLRVSLAEAIRRMAGPGGELQQSAQDRWGTGEGEGGIIGIEFVNGKSAIAWDFNCGGLFRAWVDDSGRERYMVFRAA